MHASLQLRRKGILWDAKQLKLDFDSYNDNNIHQAKLKEIEWDLKKDLLELEQPTTYPEDAPDNPDDPDGGSEEDLIL